MSSNTRWLALAATLAVAAVGLPLAGASGDAAARQINRSAGALRNDEIADIATSFAAANGDDAPTEITAIAASHKPAVDLAMPGSEIDDDGGYVDLIVIRGDFTGYMAKVPPGEKLPTGNVITLVIDRSSGEVSDWSLGDEEPELSALGKPATLVG